MRTPYRLIEDEDLRAKIRVVQKGDDDYPACLELYPRSPKLLYVCGNLPDPSVRSVAVVGSRGCDPYGRDEAERFAGVLAANGVQIISGMAYGIDAGAHKAALRAGGRTFAVLGCGVDVCYPKENYEIYREMIETGGGVISEFEPKAPPNGWHFPVRNRIISGLSDLVLVVEARLKSGSLITADYALEQGKEIFAIPGRNDDPLSAGCNRLIAQGAQIARDPEDLLAALGLYIEGKNQKRERDILKGALPLPFEAKTKFEHADDFRKVYGCLSSRPVSLDELTVRTGMDIQNLSAILVQLCLSGYAAEETHGFFCKV